MKQLQAKDRFVAPGFTFIEMLVVLGIMATLLAVIVTKLNYASVGSRDKKRLVDLKTVQSALTLYYSDEEAYPSSLTFGSSLTNADGSRTYLKEVPVDPDTTDRQYYYTSNDNQTYVLCAAMELDANIPQSGDSHYPPQPAPACGSSVDCNYCLTNF